MSGLRERKDGVVPHLMGWGVGGGGGVSVFPVPVTDEADAYFPEKYRACSHFVNQQVVCILSW